VSPERTTYIEMRPGGVALATSAMVPEGPPLASSALPLTWIMSPRPLSGFGSMLTEARSAGVEEPGLGVLAAASAFVKKGQNAPARFGIKVAANTMSANPAMRSALCSRTLYVSGLVSCDSESRSFGFNSIGKRGISVGPPNTKIAYISHSLHTSITAIPRV